MASDANDGLAHVVGMSPGIPHPGKTPRLAGGTLNATGDDLEEVLRIGMSVANVAAVKPNDRLIFRLALNTLSPSRTALGVSRPGPCEFALDLLLVEALADPAEAVAYGFGVPSIFDGKDLAQEVGDLSRRA